MAVRPIRCCSSLFAALLLLCGGVTAQTYTNPIVGGMNPDPSVIRVGGDFYLATSSFEFVPSCPIYHSLDLIHWERIGYALSRPEQFAPLGASHPSTYACTLRFHAGTYYALTTEIHHGGNFLVTAKNPAGPWSEPVPIDHGLFDPSLMFDDDGKAYYTRRGSSGIVQAEIDPASGHLLTPLRSIARGMVSRDAEGPHLYKINGWYYLALAEGGSRFFHMETIGRAHSPWGPFTPDPANPWVSEHTDWNNPVRTLGHCDLVDTPGDPATAQWWTVCLGTRHASYAHFSLGRETFLFPVTWKDGWPSINTRDTFSLTVNHTRGSGHTLPDHPLPAPPARDDFSAPNLASDWNTIGFPGGAVVSLTERPGFVRLHGQPAGLSFDEPSAFVGRRQTEWHTIGTARLEFQPRTDGDRAGLTVFMDPKYHYDVAEVLHGGARYVQLLKQVNDIHVVAAEQALSGKGPLLLRIESDANTYRFFYARDESDTSDAAAKWVLLGTGEERMIASEVADVWSGAFLAMFAESSEGDRSAPADFDWFEYQANPK